MLFLKKKEVNDFVELNFKNPYNETIKISNNGIDFNISIKDVLKSDTDKVTYYEWFLYATIKQSQAYKMIAHSNKQFTTPAECKNSAMAYLNTHINNFLK